VKGLINRDAAIFSSKLADRATIGLPAMVHTIAYHYWNTKIGGGLWRLREMKPKVVDLLLAGGKTNDLFY
jgi:hypothetical protein